MFTRNDLSKLVTAAPDPGVSMFLTTHVRGEDVRKDPVVLKNLAGLARQRLLSTGLAAADVGTILAPALALVDDLPFWQHRSHGLAVFLSRDMACHFTMPVPFTESVVIGPYFRTRPLLPLLAADGDFHLLTVTEGRVRLFEASRYTMTEEHDLELPRLDEGTAQPDDENPVQDGPVARPHVGTMDIRNAQVYGDSPPDWRKTRLVESVRRLAAAVDRQLTARGVPVVLAANAEIAGHFRKFTTLGPLLAGVIDVNPEAVDDARLHEEAYATARRHFDTGHRAAAERLAVLLGNRDPRGATEVTDVTRAAFHGRVDTLLVTEDQTVRGRYDETTAQVRTGAAGSATGPDLLDALVAQTLRHGGEVHVLPRSRMPHASDVGAVLRY